MCGRYAIFAAPHRLIELFGSETIPNFPPKYNAAPLQDHPIIVKNRMGLARWGLLPPWAEDDDKGLCAKMINARSETVSEKPAFRDAWTKGRRCLIPANGFYEWKEEGGEKQAYFLHHKSAEIIAFAGLWSKKNDLVTFTVLTKDADGAIADIHHRMPVMFMPEQAREWFAADERGANDMFKRASGRDMIFRPVGKDVGKVANDYAGLMEEVAIPASRQALLV